MTAAPNDAVTVAVPARPGFVHLVRTVVASVAARADLTFEAIEDARIAVAEACGQLLAAGGGTLYVRVAPTVDGIEMVVSSDAVGVPWPPDGLERSLGWQVLKGLSDEVFLERRDEGPAIRIVKRSAEAAAGA